MVRAKKATSGLGKRQRPEASTSGPTKDETLTLPDPSAPTFTEVHFGEWFTRLRMKRFGQSHMVDWPILT